MFEDDVTWPEYAILIQVGGMMNVIWIMFAFFWLLSILIHVVFRLSIVARWLENVIYLLFLATVFSGAGGPSAFNGDLNKWDVAKVTSMSQSKSIRTSENDLTCDMTWTHVSVIGGLRRSLGLLVMMSFEVGREVVLKNAGEIDCTHCKNVCGLWQWVMFLWDFLVVFHAFWPL